MEQKSENEKLIVRYLLGELSEEESERIEDRYFDDDDFFEEIAIVEEDLIDDYERGKLIGREREQFKVKYLSSPTRRNRVEFSRNMMSAISAARDSNRPKGGESKSWFRSLFTSRNRSLQFAALIAALLVLAVLPWLAYENIKARNEIKRLQSERATLEQSEKERAEQFDQQRARNDDLTASLESEQSKRQQLEQEIARLQPRTITEFELFSSATRSGGTTKSFTIPSGTKTIRIKLYFEPDDYKNYRATLQRADGEKVWSKTGLRAMTRSSGKEMIVSLPTELFSSGAYLLTLGGAAANGDYEDVRDYEFKVIKK